MVLAGAHYTRQTFQIHAVLAIVEPVRLVVANMPRMALAREPIPSPQLQAGFAE